MFNQTIGFVSGVAVSFVLWFIATGFYRLVVVRKVRVKK